MKAAIGFVVVVFGALVCAVVPVRAQNIEGTALTRCPGYEKDNATATQLAWSVGCLLQAIKDRDKEIVAAFSDHVACRATLPCDGPMDEFNSWNLFGRPDDRSGFGGEIPRMLDNATSVNIFPRFDDDHYAVEVLFAPRPGPAKLTGRHRDSWFLCAFYFNEQKKIWVVREHFCHFETEFDDPRLASGVEFDLDGNDINVPYMVWKPRKR